MFMVTLSQSSLFKQSKKLLIAIQDLCYFCSVAPIMSLHFEDSAAEEQASNDYTGSSKILPLPALCLPSLPQGMSAQRSWKALKGKPEQRSVKVMETMRAKGIYLGLPQTHNGLGFFSGGCSYLQMLLLHEMFWKRLDCSNF